MISALEKYEADEIAQRQYVFLEGEKKGEKKRELTIIAKMLKRGDSIAEISDFLEVPVKEVEEAKKKLKS